MMRADGFTLSMALLSRTAINRSGGTALCLGLMISLPQSGFPSTAKGAFTDGGSDVVDENCREWHGMCGLLRLIREGDSGFDQAWLP